MADESIEYVYVNNINYKHKTLMYKNYGKHVSFGIYNNIKQLHTHGK